MPELTPDQIAAWPKAELHVHLDGSLRPATMVDLAARQGKLDRLPARDAAGLRTAVRAIDDAGSLEGYLAFFDLTLVLMQTPDALKRVASEFIEDVARENVRYVEVRFSPLLHTAEGMTYEHVVDAVLEGLTEAGGRCGVEFGLIICALRGKHADESLQMAQLAVAHHHRGVVAFDLAGPEAGHPARAHLESFYHARNNLMALTIHAGESWGPSSIRQALFYCGAHRIGHGIAAVQDPELLDYLVLHQIPLEVCPTSNVQTQVAPDFARHPLKQLVEAGAQVSVNTDSRLFSTDTLSEELYRAHARCGLTAAQVRECVRNGFRSAFLPASKKHTYLDQLEKAFSA
ncbi:MAG: adenosine deaminase [Rhodothermales bacterium]|nr:adenosine deaminase [Rhodothermales bacterium]MBO6779639.1 adenosine deaminase [Rhodothermales bacterium]